MRATTMPWWEVNLPCEGPGPGRWSQLSRWAQAPTAEEACAITERMLPPTYDLDDQASAVRIENPHTIAAHEGRLLDAITGVERASLDIARHPDDANAAWLLKHFTASIPHRIKELADRIEADADASRSLRRYRWRQRHGHEFPKRPVTAILESA